MDTPKKAPMNVIVVGGSMAGLLHAIAAREHGHNVHVLEKASVSQLQSQAAGLRVGPDVQKFIEKYIQKLDPFAITLGTITYTDAAGKVTRSVPSREPMPVTTWCFLHAIFQSALQGHSAAGGRAMFDTEKVVTGVKDDGGHLMVTVSDLEANAVRVLPADLVIAADGAHSTVRNIFCPEIRPKYVGYVTWRGAVPERLVSKETKDLFLNRLAIFRTGPGYILSYNVPGDNGSRKPGETQFIWVWYDMLPEDSEAFSDTFIDCDGQRHHTTIPRGRMQPHVWGKRQQLGQSILSPPFGELLQKTTDPFISAIRECTAPSPTFLNRQVLLVGDAFCLFRPHVGLSTNQAARQALGLCRVLEGTSTWEEWENSSTEYAKLTSAMSVAYGEFSFTGVATPELQAWMSGIPPGGQGSCRSNL